MSSQASSDGRRSVLASFPGINPDLSISFTGLRMSTLSRSLSPKMAITASVGLAVALSGGMRKVAFAQVTADQTLSSTVTSVDRSNVLIENGDRIGTNLFHSFDQFSIPKASSAHFNNAADIGIIFSRVTGNSPSRINGRLSANGTADVFLMNPNGIIFGNNASLDIGGSFIGTTAESILFQDGVEFHSSGSSSPPLLTMSIPVGLQMGQHPGRIRQSQSILQTPTGQTFGLVSHGLTLAGSTIEVPGQGRIDLISLGAENTANLRQVGARWRVDVRHLDMGNASSFAPLRLRDDTLILGSGNGNSAIQLAGSVLRTTDSRVQSLNAGDRPGRGIVIRSSQRFQANNTDFDLAVQAAGDTGQLKILAPITEFMNDGGIGSIVTDNGTGNGGDFIVRGDRFTITGQNSGFGVFTTGIGNSGDVLIAVDEVTIQDNSGFGVFTEGQGNSGNVTIRGDRMVTNNESGGGMFSRNSGRAGDFNILVDEFRLTGSSGYNLSSSGERDAGNVRVEARTITIQEESGFSTTTTGTGAGGSITLKAQDIILDASQINARTEETGRAAGNLTIEAERLTLRNGAQLNAFTRSESNAGEIQVTARDRIVLSGQDLQFNTRETEPDQDDRVSPFSGFFSDTLDRSTGNGGNVTITTPYLQVEDQASISVSAQGEGNAGSLTVNANTILLRQASIRSEATVRSGGNLDLTVNHALFMTDNSRITTNANANGGNITIQSPVSIVGIQNSDIIANAIEGDGGEIRLNTQGLFGFNLRANLTSEQNIINNDTSDITASSSRGINGTININTINWEPDSDTIELPANLIDASDRIVQGCAFAGKNKFIVTGRGGRPFSPTGTTSGDRPWLQLLPDLGNIPDEASSAPYEHPVSHPVITPTSPPPSMQDFPTEATAIGLHPNGNFYLSAANVPVSIAPHPTCSARAPVSGPMQ